MKRLIGPTTGMYEDTNSRDSRGSTHRHLRPGALCLRRRVGNAIAHNIASVTIVVVIPPLQNRRHIG